MPEDDIKVTIEPQLRGDALDELEARIKRVSGEMAHAGELAQNIKFEGIHQDLAAAESLLAEKRATLERMQAHYDAMQSGAGMMSPGMMGGGGLDLGTLGGMIGGRMGGALNVVALAKQTFDTVFHAAYAPAAEANQIALQQHAASKQEIERADAVLRSGAQADGGKEAAALAAGFRERREGLEHERGMIIDEGGPLDDLKHMSDKVLGEGLRKKLGEVSKKWYDQDVTRTTGEHQEEAYDREIAILKNQEHQASGMARRMARRAGKNQETEAKQPPPPAAQAEAKDSHHHQSAVKTEAGAAPQPAHVQSYARLVAARDGAADTARLATLAHQEAPRQADGGALERLRHDMNRNHAEATHAATRKIFSRP